MDKKKSWISSKTAAEDMDLAVRTIQEWCKSGKIKAKKLGKDWRILVADWEEFKARILKDAA